MSLRINHNIASVNGHRNMLKNDMAISKSLEKLSSGLRINRAADDAAGLIISEQMRAQISGLGKAISNTETAIAMVQTAEGALDEMNTLLTKARELALHAANEGANDASQLAADQSELDNIISSISRIAENTQFGTKKLLNGSLEATSTFTANLGTPAAFDAAPTYAASSPYLAEGTYSVEVTTAYVAGTLSQAATTSTLNGGQNLFDAQAATQASGNADFAGDGTLTVTGGLVTVDGTETITDAGNDIGIAVAFGTNTYTLTTGLTDGASVNDLIAAFNAEHGSGGTGNVELSIAGGNIVATALAGGADEGTTQNGQTVTVTITDSAANSAASAAGAISGGIDAQADVTTDSALATGTSLNTGDNYTLAIVDSNGTTVFSASLAGNADGTNTLGDLVTSVDTAAAGDFDLSLAGGNFTLTALAGGTYDGVDGNNFTVRLTNATDGQAAAGAASTGGGVSGQVDAVAELQDADGNTVAQLTVAASAADGTIVSNSELGITFDLTAAAASVLGDKGTVFDSAVDSEGAVFQIGANRDQTTFVSIGDMRATALGANATTGSITDPTATLDSLRTGSYLTTTGLAQEAISIIDKAIDDVTNQRGALGAVQANTLESNVSSLRATMENTIAAESVIRDVDFAAESAMFTRNSIMIQASTAMLAQANQLPQNVLQLLG